jgi:hypothetical protein
MTTLDDVSLHLNGPSALRGRAFFFVTMRARAYAIDFAEAFAHDMT